MLLVFSSLDYLLIVLIGKGLKIYTLNININKKDK